MPDHRAEKLKALWKLKLDFEQSCDAERQLRDMPANLGDILQRRSIIDDGRHSPLAITFISSFGAFRVCL
jgi:hypothetical protein